MTGERNPQRVWRDNDSAEGRARNRRIDIVILNPALQEKLPFATPPSALAAMQPPPEAPVSSAPATVPPAPLRQ